jgi:hypothetical protein
LLVLKTVPSTFNSLSWDSSTTGMIRLNGNLLQRGSIHSWAHAVLPNARTTKVVKAAIEALRFMSDPSCS